MSLVIGNRIVKAPLETLCAICLLGLGACSSADEAKWTEQVKLHDGRIIQLERRATRGHDDFPNPGRGSLGENELSYEARDVHWHNAKRSAGWILSFDIFDGVPYLIVSGAGAEYCKAHGPAIYNAKFLRWENGAWVNVGQAGVPLARMKRNVAMNYWGATVAGDAAGRMTWRPKIEDRRLGDGGYQPVTDWLDERDETCGKALPYLFKPT